MLSPSGVQRPRSRLGALRTIPIFASAGLRPLARQATNGDGFTPRLLQGAVLLRIQIRSVATPQNHQGHSSPQRERL